MSVSYEDAIATLESMFPKWDKGTLEILLQQNNNYVERTIDAILIMEEDTSPSKIGRSNSVFGSGDDSVNGNGEILRGKHCVLPDDFLQPPGMWKQNNETFGDEQLALLLQNEMFQRELQSTLGADYMDRTQRNRNTAHNATNRSGASYSQRQSSNGNIYPSSGNATAADLGIMKSLSSMSSVAKRNLNNLALQFSTKHKQTGDGSTEAERDRLVMDEGFTRSPFQRQQDQEEEDEVITFDNPSSSLPRGGAMRRHTLSEDYNDGGKNKTSAELISPKTK